MVQKSKRLKMPVTSRESFGTNASRRMRAAGRVPGNVYGMNMGSFAVSVDPREVENVVYSDSGRNTIFTLAMEGSDQSRDVMLRELQRHPVTDQLIHVDFLRVDPKQELHVSVPVELVGTPEGVKNDGGILDFVHRSVEVSCLPDSIPEHFNVDVSALEIGHHISVKDLTAPEGVQILDDEESILAVVAAPRAEEEVEVVDED
ncbi:MAG: 50S ribosomal protein L25, partial [Acidobacteriota bacterium]|nr:50S ribosomal protein L25 [Acidobacteriota bacterium]